MLRMHFVPGREGEMVRVASTIVKAKGGTLQGSLREAVMLDLVQTTALMPSTLADGATKPSLIVKR
jgi:hypothetical protein